MTHSIRLFLFLGTLACHGADIGNLKQERLWLAPSGKSLRGTFVKVVEAGTCVEILTPTGKVHRIALSNLIEADRELIQKLGKPVEKAAPVTFMPQQEPDRMTLPVINQGDFGQKASDCVPSSFCNFLLWWDQEKVLEIPKRGDFEKKAEWVHSNVARYCGTRNTAGTSTAEAKKGFTEYFQKELGGAATLRVHTDYDVSPGNLARYTVGTNATMLEMTTIRSNGSVGGHWVALLSAAPDGRIVFHTWGARFEGVLKVLEVSDETVKRDGQIVPATTYEIEISNRGKLPKWVNEGEIRLIVDPRKWDSITTVRPYLYAEKSAKGPPPSDDLFDRKPNAAGQ
ncbi:MAG: hypothetical protein V4584_01390 [Verrucomicrobiota bacterium]